jgi:signal transduction histidine kinase
VFDFVRGAFDLLNHELESIAYQVMEDRRNVLADLGPGIVNHEINQQLQVLRDATNIINLKARSLSSKLGADEDVADLVEGLKLAYIGIDRISGIASAFNNLEKRQANAVVTIGRLVDEACTLLHYRLVRLGVAVEYSAVPQDIALQTDAALVEHILLNLVSNAIDAFNETESVREQHTHKRILIHAYGNDSVADIVIANNGPPISLSQPDSIFEKGVTTKRHGVGHGMGLYICRLVLTFLGGTIRLAAKDETPQGMSVAFCLRLPQRPEGPEDMISVAQTRPDTVRAQEA